MNWRQGNHAVREAAAHWAVLVDAGELTDEDRVALANWLQDAPLHVEEFLLAYATLSASSHVDPARTIDVEALLARSSASVVEIADAPHRNTTDADNGAHPPGDDRKRSPSRAAAAAVGALILLGGAASWLVEFPSAGETYATQRGEQRSLTLDDGSVIHINTLSEVSVRYSPSLRELTLASGEAMFEVAPDANRPFRVIAGGTIVQALGTEFNVYRQEQQTDVSVIEGEVALLAANDAVAMEPGDIASLLANASDEFSAGTPGAPARKRAVLSIGQGATVLADGTIQKVSTIDPLQNTAWMSRMLVFRNAPLGQVIREFNRYNDLQIQIDDLALAQIPLTAALRADNPQALVDLLSTSGSLAIERGTSGEIVLRRAQPSEPRR
jgi:transmembrane sensor